MPRRAIDPGFPPQAVGRERRAVLTLLFSLCRPCASGGVGMKKMRGDKNKLRSETGADVSLDLRHRSDRGRFGGVGREESAGKHATSEFRTWRQSLDSEARSSSDWTRSARVSDGAACE